MPSILKRSDYEDYLIRLYFGPKKDNQDDLFLCFRRPYRDFQRTLHGIGKFRGAKQARQQADKVLNRMFAEIRDAPAVSQTKFDDWHRAACKNVADAYKQCGYRSFNLGQAQKWLNMTFKYIYVMGEARVPGFGRLYDFCHVPLDNILIARSQPYQFPRLPCAAG